MALVWVKAGTWRERLAPSLVQAGHCQPTRASTMQSVQMGRSQWAHSTDAGSLGMAVARGRRRSRLGERVGHRMPASSSDRTSSATCSGSLRSQRPGDAM